MQSLQDQGEPATGCHLSAEGHADLEARGVAEMPALERFKDALDGEIAHQLCGWRHRRLRCLLPALRRLAHCDQVIVTTNLRH